MVSTLRSFLGIAVVAITLLLPQLAHAGVCWEGYKACLTGCGLLPKAEHKACGDKCDEALKFCEKWLGGTNPAVSYTPIADTSGIGFTPGRLVTLRYGRHDGSAWLSGEGDVDAVQVDYLAAELIDAQTELESPEFEPLGLATFDPLADRWTLTWDTAGFDAEDGYVLRASYFDPTLPLGIGRIAHRQYPEVVTAVDQGDPQAQILGLSVCSVRGLFVAPVDRLVGVSATDVITDDPLGFDQHPLGDDTAPAAGLVALFPELKLDSFVTLGVATDDGTDSTTLAPDWDSAPFNSAGTATGSWFDPLPGGTQGIAGPALDVLVAQLTVRQHRDVSGALDLSLEDGSELSGTFLCPRTPSSHPPPVPDGTFLPAMRVGRLDPLGSHLLLNWNVSGCPAAGYHLLYFDGNAVHSESDLGSVLGSRCGLNVDGVDVWSDAPDGNIWFIIVANDGASTEGSWGNGTTGVRNGDDPSGECGMLARDDDGCAGECSACD